MKQCSINLSMNLDLVALQRRSTLLAVPCGLARGLRAPIPAGVGFMFTEQSRKEQLALLHRLLGRPDGGGTRRGYCRHNRRGSRHGLRP